MATERRSGLATGAVGVYLDAIIRHQVGLLRHASSTARRVREILDATEKDVRRSIRDRAPSVGIDEPAKVRRLRKLLRELQEIRTRSWIDVGDYLADELRNLARTEPRLVDSILRTTMPTSVDTVLPDARRLAAIASSDPFQGAPIGEHLRRLRAADARRIEDQVRIGLIQGESGQQIARRVVGTVRLRGRNGVLEITRRHATTLVRTAASAVAASSRRAWSEQNRDLFEVDLFVATLDSRTTPICRALDGERFPLAQEYPRLPLHWNERSLRVALPDAEPIGRRPMKPTTERQLLREFAARRGIDAVKRRADLPRGTKKAFDEFSRARVRELVGTVTARTSYESFLRRQPAWFQNDVLGSIRGRLFRRGKLSLDKHVDRQTGRLFTLEELARMHARAFRDAGLDPSLFL